MPVPEGQPEYRGRSVPDRSAQVLQVSQFNIAGRKASTVLYCFRRMRKSRPDRYTRNRNPGRKAWKRPDLLLEQFQAQPAEPFVQQRDFAVTGAWQFRFKAKIRAVLIGIGKHSISPVYIDHRIRVPEAVGGQQPGVQIDGRRFFPTDHHSFQYRDGSALYAALLKSIFTLSGQLRRISFQRFRGSTSRARTFLPLSSPRAGGIYTGQLLNRHGEHFLVFLHLRMQHKRKSV